MWTMLFSWPVVAIIVPVLIGIGVGVMSMAPPEFWVARICFSLAALILLIRVGAWLISVESSAWERALITFLILGVVGVGWIESLRWVESRQKVKTVELEQPTFHGKIESVTIEVGTNSIVYDIDRLRQQKVNPLNLAGYYPITAYVEGDKLYADVIIYGGSGKPPIEIVHNEFVVRPPHWDKNSNKDALEVVDENKNPVFQIIYKSQSHIKINGIFPNPGGLVLAGEEGMLINPTLPRKSTLKRIFKYPSRQYPGQLN